MLLSRSPRSLMVTLGILSLALAACDGSQLAAELEKALGDHGSTPPSKPPSGDPGTDGGKPTGCGTSGCLDAVLGSAKSCEPVANLKAAASRDCETRGMGLQDYAGEQTCGQDAFRFVKYTCCPVPPPPPPPPPTCFSQVQGGLTSCKDTASWKKEALAACASVGAHLQDAFFASDCGDGLTNYVKYTCCPDVTPPPPPPPPLACFTQVLGSETSCKPISTWKEEAWRACDAAGGKDLLDYSPATACGEGLTRYVKFTCCN